MILLSPIQNTKIKIINVHNQAAYMHTKYIPSDIIKKFKKHCTYFDNIHDFQPFPIL